MAPTPSWLRASSIEVSQSELCGGMLAEGLAGGRMPAAAAGAPPVNPAVTGLSDHRRRSEAEVSRYDDELCTAR